MKKVNQKGFTLAELLIVVAILAVLVAVAIPTFVGQLEKAREATDVANVRDVYTEIAVALANGVLVKKDDVITVLGELEAKCGENAATVAIANFPIKQRVSGWSIEAPDIAGIALTVPDAQIEAKKGTLTFTFTEGTGTTNTTAKYTYLSGIEFS